MLEGVRPYAETCDKGNPKELRFVGEKEQAARDETVDENGWISSGAVRGKY